VGALDPTPGSQVIVAAIGGEGQVVTVSDDDGESWTPFPGTEKDEFSFLAFHPQSPNIVYADEFRSTNKGQSWHALSKAVAAVFRGNGDVVFAAESKGETVTISKSTDGGLTWTQPFDPIDTPEVHEIAVAPNDENRIYVTTGVSGLRIWEGSEWVEKSGTAGLERDRFGSVSTWKITVDPGNPDIVYAGNWIAFRGHSNGVFRSLDAGNTWENITYNLGPEFTPWALSVNPHNGGLYVGSSHGTWKLPPPEPVTVGRSQPSIRTSFGLHQNHPNPFNPSTAITYQLPEATGVTLKVYNIYGQQVRTLVDKRMSSGVQSVRWDGTNESGEALSSLRHRNRARQGRSQDAVDSIRTNDHRKTFDLGFPRHGLAANVVNMKSKMPKLSSECKKEKSWLNITLFLSWLITKQLQIPLYRMATGCFNGPFPILGRGIQELLIVNRSYG